MSAGGAKFQLIDSSTWREQTEFAARGDFDGLENWLRSNAGRFSSSESRASKARSTATGSGTRASTRIDDLTEIKGIGPATEKALHRHGITSFAQIATLGKRRLAELLAEFNDQFGLVDSETWADKAREILGEGFEVTQTESEILAELSDIKRQLNQEATSGKESSAPQKSKDIAKK